MLLLLLFNRPTLNDACHVFALVQATDARQHVNGLEVTSHEGSPFQVLIDGQLFGPYVRLRISPAELSGKRVVFPVMTFFPHTV